MLVRVPDDLMSVLDEVVRAMNKTSQSPLYRTDIIIEAIEAYVTGAGQ